MSAPTNDGGPAFPHFKTDPYSSKVEICPQGGMTLRDYFAGQALVGLLAAANFMSTAERIRSYAFAEDWIGQKAYEAAGAMLAAREGKQ
jgi:hypothetical protein